MLASPLTRVHRRRTGDRDRRPGAISASYAARRTADRRRVARPRIGRHRHPSCGAVGQPTTSRAAAMSRRRAAVPRRRAGRAELGVQALLGLGIWCAARGREDGSGPRCSAPRRSRSPVRRRRAATQSTNRASSGRCRDSSTSSSFEQRLRARRSCRWRRCVDVCADEVVRDSVSFIARSTASAAAPSASVTGLGSSADAVLVEQRDEPYRVCAGLLHRSTNERGRMIRDVGDAPATKCKSEMWAMVRKVRRPV